MLAALGGHAVGMSTVLECIAARWVGLEVCGVSLVTNAGAGYTGEPLTHEEVLASGCRGRPAAPGPGPAPPVRGGCLTQPEPPLATGPEPQLLARQGLLERTAARPARRRPDARRHAGAGADGPVCRAVVAGRVLRPDDGRATRSRIGDSCGWASIRTTLHLLTTDDALAMAPLTSGVHRRVFGSTGVREGVGRRRPRRRSSRRPGSRSSGRRSRRRSSGRTWPSAGPTATRRRSPTWPACAPAGPDPAAWDVGPASEDDEHDARAWSGDAARPTDGRRPRASLPAGVRTGDDRRHPDLVGLERAARRSSIDSGRACASSAMRTVGTSLDVEDAVIADPDLPAPVRFLPQYDNVFLSHDDRSRIEGAMSWGIDFGWRGPILVDGTMPPRGASCERRRRRR